MKIIKSKKVKSAILVWIISVLLLSCTTFKTALYNQYSIERSISLKVEALELMNEATEPYTEHIEEIKNYLKEFQKLEAYEKNRENNELSYEMLQRIGNPENNLLGGFLKRWKEKRTISKVMVTASKEQISDAFDLLIKYESKKNKKNKEEISKYLTN